MIETLRLVVQFLRIAFFLVLFVFQASCLQKEIKKTNKEKTVRPTVTGVPIPVQLWEKLEEVYIDPVQESHLEKLEVKPQEIEEMDSMVEEKVIEKSKDIPIKYMPVTVQLLDGNEGTLATINHVLKYGHGGGDLDFADYVPLKEGSFRFKVDLPEVREEMERLKVYFWPNGRQRKVESEILGSDCRKIMDLTDFYGKVLQKEGLRVVANRQKYITLLAGTYVFALKQSNTLYLAQLTVEDSRYKLLHCRQ